jgi:hypothetical protein
LSFDLRVLSLFAFSSAVVLEWGIAKLPRPCDDAHVALVPDAVSPKIMVQREHLTENLSTVWTIVVRVTLVAFFTKFGFPKVVSWSNLV